MFRRKDNDPITPGESGGEQTFARPQPQPQPEMPRRQPEKPKILEKRKQQKELEAYPPKPEKPHIDSEHEIYKYNGEYWQDELGYYRYEVTSICKE